MKRFYKTVTVSEPGETSGDGQAVLLDGKPVRTPGGRELRLGSRGLAAAVAGEWRDQGPEIDKAAMPLTALGAVTLDLVATARASVVAEIVRFGETDLLCYWAEAPAALRARQEALWRPVLDWALSHCGLEWRLTDALAPVAQPAATIAALEVRIGDYCDPEVAALRAVTGAAGSVVLGIALIEGFLDGAAVAAASLLDEQFQIEQWGDDEEAAARRRAVARDIEAAARFVALARGD